MFRDQFDMLHILADTHKEKAFSTDTPFYREIVIFLVNYQALMVNF